MFVPSQVLVFRPSHRAWNPRLRNAKNSDRTAEKLHASLARVIGAGRWRMGMRNWLQITIFTTFLVVLSGWSFASEPIGQAVLVKTAVTGDSGELAVGDLEKVLLTIGQAR